MVAPLIPIAAGVGSFLLAKASGASNRDALIAGGIGALSGYGLAGGFGSWFKEAVNFSNSNRKLSSLALSSDVISMVSTEDEILKTTRESGFILQGLL